MVHEFLGLNGPGGIIQGGSSFDAANPAGALIQTRDGSIYGAWDGEPGYGSNPGVPGSLFEYTPASQAYSFIDVGQTTGALASDDGSYSSASGDLVRTRGLVIPGPPGNVIAVSNGANVTISWTRSEYAIVYEVRRSATSGGPYKIIGVVPGTASDSYSYTDRSAPLGAPEYYVVVAHNGVFDVDGPPSAEASATAGTPPAPTGLMALVIGRAIRLTWAPSAGATSYNIYVGRESGMEGTRPAAIVIDSRFTLLIEPKGSSVYYFQVSAVNAAGQSPRSAEISSQARIFFRPLAR